MAITKKLYDSKFKNERILRQSRLEMRNRYDSFYRTIDGRAVQLRAGAKRGFAIGSEDARRKTPPLREALPCRGGPLGVRTLDLGIKSPLLCQLS